jgi:hypothetical protein
MHQVALCVNTYYCPCNSRIYHSKILSSKLFLQWTWLSGAYMKSMPIINVSSRSHQNYCMVLMLISTLLLPSCTPHRTPTLYVTKLWYWWFQHTRFIYLHFSFCWWCGSLDGWRSRTTTHKKLRHSVNVRLLCLFSSFKDNCCGMNMQRMPW